MPFVYILKSINTGRFYIGSTNDINRRMKEHKLGKTRSVRSFIPFELVFRQETNTLKGARYLERKLKRYKSKVILNKIISDGYIKVTRE